MSDPHQARPPLMVPPSTTLDQREVSTDPFSHSTIMPPPPPPQANHMNTGNESGLPSMQPPPFSFPQGQSPTASPFTPSSSSPTNANRPPLILPSANGTSSYSGAAQSLMTQGKLNIQNVKNESSSYAHILILGRSFRRHGNLLTKSFGTDRYLWCSPSLDTIYWAKTKNDQKYLEFPSKELQYVGPLRSKSGDLVSGSNLAFSLDFGERGILDLETDTTEDRDFWVRLFIWLKENNSSVSRPFNFQHTVSVNSDFSWELQPGQTIQSIFDLSTLIGSGTFGRVHKAIHKETGFTVAVKLVNSSNLTDIGELKKEVDVLKQCRHRNIIDYFGCYGPDAEGYLWTIMNYCQFGSVIDLLIKADIYLTEKQISYIIASTLCGIHYLHQKNILHRDIKARNILVSNNGGIKLTDFGISKLNYVDDQTFNQQYHSFSGAGTPHWMAPEIIADNPASFKSDVWSLGITAIELCIGLPPRANENVYQVMNNTLNLPPPVLPPPPPGRPPWSPAFHDFVARCLDKNPTTRASAQDLLKHPFVQQGIQEIRCLDDILNSLEQPLNPSDNVSGAGKNDDHEVRPSNAHLYKQQVIKHEQQQRQMANNLSGAGGKDDGHAGGSASHSRSSSDSSLPSNLRVKKGEFSIGDSSAALESGFSFTIPHQLATLIPYGRLRFMEDFGRPPFVSVVIGEPQTRGSGLSSHSSYPLRVTANLTPNARSSPVFPDSPEPGSGKLAKILLSTEANITWRRFSDFEWLYETMTFAFPDCLLPPLPEKSHSNRFDENILLERRQALQWLVESIARHPILSRSFVYHGFIVLEDTKLPEFKRYVKTKIDEVRKIQKQRYQQQLTTPPIIYDYLYPSEENINSASASCHHTPTLQYLQQHQQQNRNRQQDYTFYRACEVTPSIPLFARLKKNHPLIEELLFSPDGYMLTIIEAYCGDLTKILQKVEARFLQAEQKHEDLLKNLSKIGMLYVRLCEASEQGKNFLLIQSRRSMTQRVQAQGYHDVNLSRDDINDYVKRKIQSYITWYENHQREKASGRSSSSVPPPPIPPPPSYSNSKPQSPTSPEDDGSEEHTPHDPTTPSPSPDGTSSSQQQQHDPDHSPTSESSTSDSEMTLDSFLDNEPYVPPILTSKEIESKLSTMHISAETSFTPALTWLLQRLSNNYALILNDFLKQLHIHGRYLIQLYIHKANGLRGLINSKRDTLLLQCQHDTMQVTAPKTMLYTPPIRLSSSQSTTTGGSSGNAIKTIHNTDQVIDPAQAIFRNRVGLSPNESINESSIQQQLGITVVPPPPKHIVEKYHRKLDQQQSGDDSQSAMVSPSQIRYDNFCHSIVDEFTLLQRQKHAHMSYACQVLAKCCRQQAQQEFDFWDALLVDLEVLPSDETFFDLPL